MGSRDRVRHYSTVAFWPSLKYRLVFLSMNLGRGRPVPGQKGVGVKVHRTVKLRMEADGLEEGKYRPKAKLEVEPTWVD
jgi:hypothetical protein